MAQHLHDQRAESQAIIPLSRHHFAVTVDCISRRLSDGNATQAN